MKQNQSYSPHLSMDFDIQYCFRYTSIKRVLLYLKFSFFLGESPLSGDRLTVKAGI